MNVAFRVICIGGILLSLAVGAWYQPSNKIACALSAAFFWAAMTLITVN